MGLLDGVLGGMGGQPQQRPTLGNTVAAGVVLALLVKGIRQYQASHGGVPDQGRSFDPNAQPAPSPQAGGGGLGGILGSLGGLLSGLGGAGALGALIGRFQQKGFGEQADSWVGAGPNQAIASDQVGAVLGEDTLQELEQKTGLSRQDLLAQLAHELPQAINAATPQGRLPADDDELHRIAAQPAAQA